MKVFVCEYVSGGGLYREALPDALAREGLMMRDTLLEQLSEIDDISVIITRDIRVVHPSSDCECRIIDQNEDIWQVWASLIAEVDAVWIIAPESGGVLYRLSCMVETQGKALLGANSQSVDITTSKSKTAQLLNDAGILVVPTYPFNDRHMLNDQAIVLKPDDGVDCEDTFYFQDMQSLNTWMDNISGRELRFIVQPYVTGISASISMLCRDGKAWVLSCNRQNIALTDSGSNAAFSYKGGIVNGMLLYRQAFTEIAQSVAKALSGLSGYAGIDVMVSDDGRVYVLEVNPRLTTSFVGLRKAIGVNPARLVLDLFYNKDFELPPLMTNQVEVLVNA